MRYIKLGRETPSRIRVWSLIWNKKIDLFDNTYCHATVKPEAIAHGRRCW
jgi:hypothetical protein